MKKKINPKAIEARDVYAILSSAIAPRPIAFVTTIDAKGNVNLSPFSFFNVFGANPPTLVFSPVRSMRTLENKDTLLNIEEVKEVTVSIVNYSMVEQMSLASTAYPRGVNEYSKSGFTPSTAEMVRPPFVTESPISFECRVDRVIEMGKEGGAGNLVICEVLMMHIDEDQIDENGMLDSAKLDLVARLGGNYYTRASGPALFEIPKPIRSHGIGVDSLPKSVQESNILSGNNIGRLGNLERLPDSSELESIELDAEWSVEDVHQRAKVLIEENQTNEALLLLLAADAKFDL